MAIDYKGEHLFPGHLGQFFVVLTFGSALLSFLSYFFATTDKEGKNASWQRLGRIAFIINSISIVGMGTCLFYILYNHYFEYHYAWAYTSKSLPVYYLVSGFWNGQEGGFLLWTFWTAVLGNILIWKAKSWERPVMTVIALSQAVLGTMVLGIDILGTRIGSSPFLLLRDALQAPIFSSPDYLSFINDGQGMNPSLQNYWMVIHPPTLFLGLASVVVPFSYAIAGLWQKRYTDWIKPAIPYALFSAMILGTGIIMGSFWAYESLNFGGFWAWDPIENASVFPWLIMVGALHVMIVFKNTGHSYVMAAFLALASFILVWYSSFLARSGILGDTSVHSFTDEGMFWQLVTGILIFLALTIYFLVVRWKDMPRTKKDEDTYSREFWMFVGAVFLALSCLQLIVVTSVPVFNAMFGTKIAPPNNEVALYNVFQAAFAILVTVLSGFAQFLKYKKTDPSKFLPATLSYLLVAVLVAAAVVYATGIYHLKVVFIILMIGSVYSILANGKILVDAFKGKIKLAGSAIAHIGFGLLMVGALIAAGTSKVVSENKTGLQIGNGSDTTKANNPRENILVYRNEPVKMGKYLVNYVGDSISAPDHFYKIVYQELNNSGKVQQQFMLKPKVQVNKNMGGFTASPDTKHYLFHDLYTHITMTNSLSVDENQEGSEDHGQEDDSKNYDPPMARQVSAGDTIRFREGYIIFKGLSNESSVSNLQLGKNDAAIGADLEVVSHGKNYAVKPLYVIKENNVFGLAKKVDDVGLKITLTKIIPETRKAEITVYQQPLGKRKFIVMRAIDFPYINFFWSGTIIMVIGFLMSIFRRNKELKTSNS